MGNRTGQRDDDDGKRRAQPVKSVYREYAETILVCVIFLIFTRAFAFQQSKIPSGSMEDTLLIGDYIMVNRFVYSPTGTGFERAILPVREIRRGDVIVFKQPDEPEVDYIKRVVGVPGDTIEIRRGYVYVNGESVDEPYVNDDYREPGFDGPWTVPADRFFVMGDHRDKSSDSRRWGTVPRELIKGRALLIWWSYEEDDDVATRRGLDNVKAMLAKLVTFPWRSRWSRCFTLIR